MNSLEYRPGETPVIKEALHVLVFIALMCLIMPFIEVNAKSGDYSGLFSIYDLGTSFHRSDIALSFWDTSRSLVTSVKVIAWALIIATLGCIFVSFNPNRTKMDSNCFFPLLVTAGITLVIFIALYFYTGYLIHKEFDPKADISLRAGGVVFMVCICAVIVICLIKTIKKPTVVSGILVMILIPLTIMFGVFFLGDRKYFAISLLIIAEIMLPFFVVFEKRQPTARELIVIAVVAAIAAAGRCAFFMVPHFKPVLAIVIIASITLGPEAGFLVGALSEFVSNFFFGQGPWTPWQMLAFGIVGFITGVLYKKGLLSKKRRYLCVWGFIMALVPCGFILNTSVIFTTAVEIKSAAPLAIYLSGIPVDTVHGVSTFIFLYFLTNPMCEKLERIKKKYGIMDISS